jgi:hypothetical protein
MRKSTIVLAAVALEAVACGAGDGPPATDAGGPESGPNVRLFVSVSTDNSACFPRLLPVGSDGTVLCHLLVVLPAGISCDAAKGLAPADAALSASLGAQIDLGSRTVCEATQLGSASLVDGSCVAATVPGWCAVTSSDAGQCAEAIRRSASFDVTPGALLLLTC